MTKHLNNHVEKKDELKGQHTKTHEKNIPVCM